MELERKQQVNQTAVVGNDEMSVMLTPAVDEDYWTYRVQLGDQGQAVLGFPKFNTIGIGFAKETDWNTNLPYTCDSLQILQHIWHNRGDETITKEAVVEAIELIQKAVVRDGAA